MNHHTESDVVLKYPIQASEEEEEEVGSTHQNILVFILRSLISHTLLNQCLRTSILSETAFIVYIRVLGDIFFIS